MEARELAYEFRVSLLALWAPRRVTRVTRLYCTTFPQTCRTSRGTRESRSESEILLRVPRQLGRLPGKTHRTDAAEVVG